MYVINEFISVFSILQFVFMNTVHHVNGFFANELGWILDIDTEISVVHRGLLIANITKNI